MRRNKESELGTLCAHVQLVGKILVMHRAFWAVSASANATDNTTDNDACALQNHMLAIFVFERCTRARRGFVKLSWMVLLALLPERKTPQ